MKYPLTKNTPSDKEADEPILFDSDTIVLANWLLAAIEVVE